MIPRTIRGRQKMNAAIEVVGRMHQHGVWKFRHYEIGRREWGKENSEMDGREQ